jgi:hypothetical protein
MQLDAGCRQLETALGWFVLAKVVAVAFYNSKMTWAKACSEV